MEFDPTPEEAESEARLLAFFRRIGISAPLHRHAAVFTVEESRDLKAALPGAHTKNLFLKDRKGALTLVSCLGERRIRIADLEKAIGRRRLSFAPPDLLWETLGVRPGAVTPFALMNDRERKVSLILDAGMMALEPLNFHPLHNKATLPVSRAHFHAFLAATGHSFEEVDFDALEAKAAARAAENHG
ncbi:prolyl-tRNA synthetase associated domain-containing protein [Pikeienuella piscinae]|uniref:Prolyl-tRNA synthetase associated domain-containing protein n=1 Tax=Pikeienuella piscinae TaxID=2748098 RepID=A0A7L5BY45_9RHOB|nr:prolyl-tRNA synthetase associated domain-containing protein [Pikeienuella piscinae]QIE56845.1 prolyl-tRNA synthetase associated domain-containing protein [Pikeienuella piscinae]